MNDLILKTVIFILKDKKSGKPFVVTHFQGFENDDEADEFSRYLTDHFAGDVQGPFEIQDMPPKRTLH
jgi:hypothetical protein